MAAAADDPMLAATDLAELLVAGGMPFREAHAVVGALVRESTRLGPSARRSRARPTPARGARAPPSSSRGPPSAGASPRGAAAPTRWRCSSGASASASRPTAHACNHPGVGGDHFVDLNGARFRYQEWGDPSSPVVVFLHGVLMHAEPYEQIVEPISAAGYRVLVLDQRGHGQSAHRRRLLVAGVRRRPRSVLDGA